MNLIGEHTDYNEGFVLPAAIDYSCISAITPRNDRQVVIYSENFQESFEFCLDAVVHPRDGWSDYPVGVFQVFLQSGVALNGVNVLLSTDIPFGAGLSSSAAVEVSLGYALLSNLNLAVDRLWLALACQRAENEFVGARCGIMDQFASCFGESGRAIMLDCRSLAHRAIPLPAALRLVVCNTMVSHEIAAGEYNARRAECEDSVQRLAAKIPVVRALRDVSLAQLNEYRDLLTPLLYRRCRHVISENHRVLRFADALETGNLHSLGSLMANSHASLRDDYQVSCRELDVMVEIAAGQKGVYGARMTGGGFGGCTINLVDSAHAAEFTTQVAAEYFAATGIHPEIYICSASEGARELFS